MKTIPPCVDEETPDAPPAYQIGLQSLRLHPPYLAAALKLGEAHLYLIYEVLRTLGRNSPKGDATNGLFPKTIVLSTICTVMGLSVTSSGAYAYLAAGDGKYWRVERPAREKRRQSYYKSRSDRADEKKRADRRRVGVYSPARVDERLQPTMAATAPVELPIGELFARSSGRRGDLIAFCVAVIAAKGSGSVSLATLCEITGLSRSTVYRSLRRCSGLIVKECYEVLHTARDKAAANVQRNRLICHRGRNIAPRLRVRERAGKFVLLAQRPNLYSFPIVRPVGLQRRPDALKTHDAVNRAGLRRSTLDPRGAKLRSKMPLAEQYFAPIPAAPGDNRFEMFWEARGEEQQIPERPSWSAAPYARWEWDKKYLLDTEDALTPFHPRNPRNVRKES